MLKIRIMLIIYKTSFVMQLKSEILHSNSARNNGAAMGKFKISRRASSLPLVQKLYP